MLSRVSAKATVAGFAIKDRFDAKRAKGVNFLEYALLAMLVVGVFGILYLVFKNQIKDLMNKVFDNANSGVDAANSKITGDINR